MRHNPRTLQTLLQLARREARRRAPAPACAPDEAQIRRLAHHALQAREQGAAPRGEHEPKPASWAVAFERLCWWGAGAAAALCLFLGALHRPPPEPEVFESLLEWPAANAASTPDLF